MEAVITLDSLLVLAAIAVTMTWTPGPNNVMLTASGAAYGMLRTIPHALGVALGFPVMLFLVAIGSGSVFETWTILPAVLSWIGFIAMLWFSWKIATATAGNTGGTTQGSQPLTLLQAAAFQWINPKAWTFAIWISASYAGAGDVFILMLLASLVFLISGLGSSVAWSAFGAIIGGFLGTGKRLKVFNCAMALLLSGSAFWMMAVR